MRKAQAAALLLAVSLCRDALAQTVTEFFLPESTLGYYPRDIATGPDGAMWFTQLNAPALGRISLNGSMRQFPVPGIRGSWDITTGPDGNLWFTAVVADSSGERRIGRMSPEGEVILFDIPVEPQPFSAFRPLGDITAGADGNVWVSKPGEDRLARITPNGIIREFLVPTTRSSPGGLVSGPDGNLWFIESASNKIGRFKPTLVMDEFPIPDTYLHAYAAETTPIAAGPAGKLWFSLPYEQNKMGSVTLNGETSVFPLNPALGPYTLPQDLIAGPDGNLWFTSYSSLVRMTPEGATTAFSSAPVGSIKGLALAPDCSLWYTGVSDRIGRLSGIVGKDSLCLNTGRFRVQVHFETPDGGSGQGTGVPITSDTGAFWFFNPENLELVVKVLDARPVNGHYWVFAGALSNVAYTLSITDLQTGIVRSYTNPAGQLASFADTSAFGFSGEAPSRASAGGVAASNGASAAIRGAAMRELCSSSSSALCLNGSRFRVDVSWSAPTEGTSGEGRAVPLSADTGYFWFFDRRNVELMVKVLDGRAINGKFWVFYGALSNVAYTLRVTDTLTGATRTYINPAGQLASAADTDAF